MSRLPTLTEYRAAGGVTAGCVWLGNQGVGSCVFIPDAGERETLCEIRYDEDRDRGRDIYLTAARELVAVARPVWGGVDGRKPGVPVVELEEPVEACAHHGVVDCETCLDRLLEARDDARGGG